MGVIDPRILSALALQQPQYTANYSDPSMGVLPPDATQVAPQDPSAIQNVVGGANAIDNLAPYQQSAPAAAQPQHKTWRDYVGAMLSNFGAGLSQSSQARTSGQAFLGGFGGALVAPYERGVEQRKLNIAQTQAESLGAYRQAQASQYGMVNFSPRQFGVDEPDFPVPEKNYATLAAAYQRGTVSTANNKNNNDTKRLAAGYDNDGNPLPLEKLSIPQHVKAVLANVQQELTQARVDALNANPKTPAGQVALQKLAIAQQHANAATAMASAATSNSGVNYAKYLGDYFGKDTSGNALPGAPTDDSGQPMGLKTAGVDKAPATTIQNAVFARSGLNRLNDAEAAINKLEKMGVFSGVAQNKMEEWLFGKGLLDTSLSPEARQLMGTARAGLAFTNSAALRAHTGRTSREIYDDIKSQNRLGQSMDVLHGALNQTRSMLTDYAGAASNKNIRAIRSGNNVPTTSSPVDDFVAKHTKK